jgi:hypothetical protein
VPGGLSQPKDAVSLGHIIEECLDDLASKGVIEEAMPWVSPWTVDAEPDYMVSWPGKDDPTGHGGDELHEFLIGRPEFNALLIKHGFCSLVDDEEPDIDDKLEAEIKKHCDEWLESHRPDLGDG